MSELNTENIADLHEGIVEAICRVSVNRQGENPANPTQNTLHWFSRGLPNAHDPLAHFLEGVPDLETPEEVRRVPKTIAKKLRIGIADTVAFEKGGQPLLSVVIRSNGATFAGPHA